MSYKKHLKKISKWVLIIFAILIGLWLFIFLFGVIAVRVFKVNEETYKTLWNILYRAMIIGSMIIAIILLSKEKKSE